jgi:hypothetical protein
MAKVSTPKTLSETKETLEKIFYRIKNESKESTILGIVNRLGYDAKFESLYPKWSDLEIHYNELMEAARLVKVQRDTVMEDELRPLMLEIKNIVTFTNAKNPILNSAWGFPTTINPTKKVPTEKSIKSDMKRVEAKANAFQEAKAMSSAIKDAKENMQKSSAKVSLVVS